MESAFAFQIFGVRVDATALSIVGGVIAWLFQHWRDQKRERIQKTVELMLPFTTSDRLAEGNVLMAQFIAAGTAPSYGADAQTDRRIIDLLDYYEFLCELLNRKVLDEKTVLSLRGGVLGKTFSLCEGYIGELRRLHGRGVYAAIESVVERHALAPAAAKAPPV
jgi:hypothetical protein